MPRLVNHDHRRIEIVEAAWRIIARGGFSAATMREIASEAGFANGGLKHYFASKDDLLAAAFQHTFFRINERAAHTIGDKSGLEAIRLLCLEMLPLDQERFVESRVTVAFWDRAASSSQLMKIHADSYAIWRNWMEQELEKARHKGQITTDESDQQIIDEFLAVTAGMRVMPILDSTTAEPDGQLRLIDSIVERLSRPDTARTER